MASEIWLRPRVLGRVVHDQEGTEARVLAGGLECSLLKLLQEENVHARQRSRIGVVVGP